MKNIVCFLLITIYLWPAETSAIGYEKTCYTDTEQFDNSIIINQIDSLITKKFSENITDLKVYKQYVTDLHLFWNDPSFKEGPTISIDKECWIVNFQTCTYNDDKSLRYRDYWGYCIPVTDDLICRFNNYHGVGYHGGSRVMFKSQRDKRFEGTQYESFVRIRSDEQEEFFATLVKLLRELE